MTLTEGITARLVEGHGIRSRVLLRDGDPRSALPDHTVVLVSGATESADVWQETMLALPQDVRTIAVDLRPAADQGLASDTARGTLRLALLLAALNADEATVVATEPLESINVHLGDAKEREEAPEVFRARILAEIDYTPPSSAPPTEAIILRSSD